MCVWCEHSWLICYVYVVCMLSEHNKLCCVYMHVVCMRCEHDKLCCVDMWCACGLTLCGVWYECGVSTVSCCVHVVCMLNLKFKIDVNTCMNLEKAHNYADYI